MAKRATGNNGRGFRTVGPDGSLFRDAAATAAVDLAHYSPGMRRRWEVNHAHVTALVFEDWLRRLVRAERIPAAAAELPVTLLWLWVECELVERAMHPDQFEVEGGGEVEDDGPRADGDAIAHGLSVVAPPPRVRLPAAIHPGCQRAKMLDGVACDNLRRYGERLCPACSREFLKGQRQTRRAA